METVIVRHSGPRAFLERAERWLLRREAENNLSLGVAASLVGARPPPAPASPLYFATIERGRDIVGCAFRTPPYKLGLTRMPLEAVPLLARSVAEVYEELPAVLGPEQGCPRLRRRLEPTEGGEGLARSPSTDPCP